MMWNRAVQVIESRLRQSSIGERLRGLAVRHTRLHRLLLRSRDLLMPYRRYEGLTRYQARAVEKFLKIAGDRGLLRRVLEVGSDEQGEVAAHLQANGAHLVVGINPSSGAWRAVNAPRANLLVQADARAIPVKESSIDAMFSVATLKHINDLELAMSEFHRTLRPGGILFVDFGPIWSSSVGHHVYAKVGEQEARHWKPGLNPVPDFGHLLYSPSQLRSRLLQKCSPELTEAIVEWIYQAQDINRLFFEDYLRIFESSPFELESLAEVTERVRDADHIRLKEMHPPYTRFDCRMVEAVFRKVPGAS